MATPIAGLRAALLALALAAALPAQGARAQGLAGPYLAGSHADLRGDYAAAARYYGQALAAAPETAALLNAALVAHVNAGELAAAIPLARRLEELGDGNQVVALALMAEALKSQDFARAGALATAGEARVNPLFSALIEGWALIGQGEFADGIAVFEAMTGDGESASDAYGRLNLALAHALAGDFGTAARILDGDGEPLHVNRLAVQTHMVALSQIDRGDDALEIVERLLAGGGGDAGLEAMRDALAAGETLPFTQLDGAADGAAAAYAALAGALVREDSLRLGLYYARLASHVRPDYPEVFTLIGDTLTRDGQYQLAVAAYGAVPPGSAWFTPAEIGRADALARAGRVDEAVEVLSSLARARPAATSVHIALGDILREAERFAPAAAAYSDAIALIDAPQQSHWRLFYVRGIAYERTDRWPEAEADFRRALELNPGQPSVLNYLGYSLVEQRRNLDEAERMIREAVEQRPQDGYITDSLGWVLYRLGRYQEAVAPMERAVELAPVDPVINDHLGDVLWMVGRKMEARFQWKRALSFDPEPDVAKRIRRKLEVGLDQVLKEEAGDAPADRAAAGAQ